MNKLWPGLLLFCVLFAPQKGAAAIIRTSQIAGYKTGNLGADSSTGQQDQWSVVGNAGSITVTNGSGSLDGTSLGLVASAGDRVFIGTTDSINTSRNQFVANGTFPQSVETNLYYSFLYKFNNAADVSADGEIIIRVNRANSGTGTPQHWDLLARNAGGQLQLGLAKAGGITNYASLKLNAGQTFFVVVRQHIIPGAQNDVYDLWINPARATLGVDEASVPPPLVSVGTADTDGTEDQSSTGPGRLALGSGLNAEFDELRIASTWAEATPPAGQCVPAGVSRDPESVTQVAELSAGFSIEATGTSAAIQWQKRTNSGGVWQNIPEAIASSYTTPPLALSESGAQYRALVAVACNNSSATSGVATVTLLAPTNTALGLVLQDTFVDPDLGFDDRANPPVTSSNSVWYTSVTDNLTAFGQGGSMVGTPTAGSSILWLGYFTETDAPPVHLIPGRALKVTLPFTPNGYAAHTNNAGLRIGLFDYADGGVRITGDGSAAGGSRGNGRGVRGYMLNLDFGPAFSVGSPLQLLARSFLADDNLMGSIGDFLSLGSGPAGGRLLGAPAFEAGRQYTLELTAARTAVNSMDLTVSITGGATNLTFTVADTNFVYHRFDSIGIRANSLETSADSFTFPEFKVEAIEAAQPAGPFRITSAQAVAGGGLKLTWESQAGRAYEVQFTPTLAPANWTTLSSLQGAGSSTSYTAPVPPRKEGYFRVVTGL